MHWFDNFKNPVFKPDVVIDIDDVIEEKYGDKGKHIIFSKAYAVYEYGRPLTRELRKELFPF